MRLQPGDVLLYRPKGLFGWAIRIKTWHAIAHVEVYVGAGQAVASRDGLGVGRYPLRREQLVKVCRPNRPFDLEAAMEWFRALPDTPYGWLDLGAFIGLPWDHEGIVCSPFAADFLRAGGLDPFDAEPSRNIAPFQFDVSPYFSDLAVEDGDVVTESADAGV